jgi:hypothetical protein
MGMATAICLERGIQPSEMLLSQAREAGCVEEVLAMIDRWFAKRANAL